MIILWLVVKNPINHQFGMVETLYIMGLNMGCLPTGAGFCNHHRRNCYDLASPQNWGPLPEDQNADDHPRTGFDHSNKTNKTNKSISNPLA